MAEKPMIKKDDMPICEAANYFKEEILEIMPDIPRTSSRIWCRYTSTISTAYPRKRRRRSSRRPASDSISRCLHLCSTSLKGRTWIRVDHSSPCTRKKGALSFGALFFVICVLSRCLLKRLRKEIQKHLVYLFRMRPIKTMRPALDYLQPASSDKLTCSLSARFNRKDAVCVSVDHERRDVDFF